LRAGRAGAGDASFPALRAGAVSVLAAARTSRPLVRLAGCALDDDGGRLAPTSDAPTSDSNYWTGRAFYRDRCR
jgi:hypothetical protein